MNQEEKLKQFCREYLAWLEAGAVEHEVFKHYYGLCTNYFRWLVGLSPAVKERHLEFMNNKFVNNRLDSRYPFNKNGREYFEEMNDLKGHLNPKRIAWVKQQSEK